MTSDGDIQFGDVAEDALRRQVRPDANRHFVVRSCGTPLEYDLPVFFDLDALKQMELHATTDTSVELGGVMLGGQFVDQDDRPFVVVNHALAAEHYESTKGSFKFTHETWSDITRQRASFPAELKMVGWYHTHPDWGVFLSGMDTFICEHFFNKPLDIALVIDPCRGDRGVFYWAGDGQRETRRAQGFHVMTSRFRADELDACVYQWEQEMQMAGRPGSTWGPPPGSMPYIPVPSPTPPWLILTVLGSFFLQFALLLLLVWRITVPPDAAPPVAEAAPAAVTDELQRWRTEERRQWEADAKLEIIDRIVASAENGGNLASQLATSETRVALLEASLQGLDAARQEAQQEADRRARELESVRQNASKREAQMAQELKDAQTQVAQYKERNETLRTELAGLRGDPLPTTSDPAEAGLPWAWWMVGAGLAVLVVVCGIVYAMVAVARRRAAWNGGKPV